jgi:DNA helicase-2/ATP-dependent DNA helicase PcrA
MSADTILANLNPSQRAAVSSTARTLAILAGPGSGKTHTLTSRTAWLLKHEGLQPWNIIVATFTVKAAREMKERIGKLIGDGLESKLVLGTFHSIARRYLARYGHLIDIPKEFGIADSSDSLSIIKRIVKRQNLTIDASAARSRISSRKAKGAEHQTAGNGKVSVSKSLEIQEFETCYTEYEEALKRSNLLDYDDLLLRCVDLLRAYPSCVSNVEAVLIDEFQDTNLVQFDLMRLLASQRKRVTIVGDPDQSIYGFRSAETKNFKRMLKQYPETVTIPLEENYRSSGAILLTALEVIQQDEGRIAKHLMPTHTVGTRPVLRKLEAAHVEAKWIVAEIKRCLALTGDLMTFNDIAILLRSAALSRHIESALGKAGIAYRMVGGHRFFDRVEVKLVLDYLRVINQPDNNNALARIINVPSRKIGETTIKSLLEEADQSGITLWILILEHAQGIKSVQKKLNAPAEQGLSSFVNIVLTARKKFLESTESESKITDLIDYIIRKTSLEQYLEKNYPEDHEARWANVEELINQASDFSNLVSTGSEDDEALPDVEGLKQSEDSNVLSRFLANIALASEIKGDETSIPIPQVTISTIHAAKGLEWPVVFIPAAYEGSIPHSRSDDGDEERRLLYVAMTRAKALLYMSYPLLNSRQEQTILSPFLVPQSLQPYLEDKGPSFTSSVTGSIAQILNRSAPKIDLELLKDLDSLEDDCLPIDGSKPSAKDADWTGQGGNHHYTQGQQAPKRRRIDDIGANISLQECYQATYSTTMGQAGSFTTARVTMQSEFVSAGSHFKELSEKSINCVVEKSTQVSSKSKHSEIDLAHKKTYEQKTTKTTLARSTRRPVGQATIQGFFSKPRPPPPSVKPPNSNDTFPQPALPKLPPIAHKITYTAPSDISMPKNDSVILPTLAGHRLGSAKLTTPIRYDLEEEARNKKAYSFLSSSPPRPERHVENFECKVEPVPLHIMPETDTGNATTGVWDKNIPATTMHNTTMARLSTLSMPKRNLGLRREVKPWSAGGGQAFVPPRRVRPP